MRETSMSDLETKFRHLEIFPGARYPITRDLRDEIVAAVVNGEDPSVINKRVAEFFADPDYATYLGDLLDCPPSEALNKADGLRGTISQWRIARDKRKGTYVPLVNGEW
jgi:hypothetical protein